MTFETYTTADVSTDYLTDSDLDLIRSKDAPGHLANLDDKGSGAFFYTPLLSDPLGNLREEMEEYASECRKFGLSERFIEIMRGLQKEGIRYVWFDATAGGDIDGMEYFIDPATLREISKLSKRRHRHLKTDNKENKQ